MKHSEFQVRVYLLYIFFFKKAKYIKKNTKSSKGVQENLSFFPTNVFFLGIDQCQKRWNLKEKKFYYSHKHKYIVFGHTHIIRFF